MNLSKIPGSQNNSITFFVAGRSGDHTKRFHKTPQKDQSGSAKINW